MSSYPWTKRRSFVRFITVGVREVLARHSRRMSPETRSAVENSLRALDGVDTPDEPTQSRVMVVVSRNREQVRNLRKHSGPSYVVLAAVNNALVHLFFGDEQSATTVENLIRQHLNSVLGVERVREIYIEARARDARGRRPRAEVAQAFRALWLAGLHERAYELAVVG